MKKELKVILCILLVAALVAVTGVAILAHEEKQGRAVKANDIKGENDKTIGVTGQESKSYFYGKVIEAKENYIIVEPNKEEEIRKSCDKISIDLEKNNDMIYQIGQNVKITYTGYVMETYPAKVNAINIELKSAEAFELRFNEEKQSGAICYATKTRKIIDKTKTDQYNYNIYEYMGNVNIVINGKEMALKDALLENKITMEEIIKKANEDLNNKKITGDMYKDGGSMIYQYKTYTIIKCHTIEGNRDVYIGPKGMSINDVI